MKAKHFDRFWRRERKHLRAHLIELKKEICDDYRAHECDTVPGMAITISIDETCGSWSIQTGDNSYAGACYFHPYWGTGALYRRSNCDALARELIDDLATAIEFTD